VLRKDLLILLAVLAAVAGILLPIVYQSPSRISRASCARIRPGMTRAEVETILGGPPGAYDNEEPPFWTFRLGQGPEFGEEMWFGREGMVTVWFGDGWDRSHLGSRVRECRFNPRVESPLFDRVRRRLARWWERGFSAKP
jgi:hypothetical protein